MQLKTVKPVATLITTHTVFIFFSQQYATYVSHLIFLYNTDIVWLIDWLIHSLFHQSYFVVFPIKWGFSEQSESYCVFKKLQDTKDFIIGG